MMETLIGLDVGSTSVKAALFDIEGRELAFSESNPYQLLTPEQGWVEQNPQEVYQSVIHTLKDIVNQVDIKTNPVRAISMSVQSGSLIPVDKSGKPLDTMITWMDGRTRALVNRWVSNGIQEKVRTISGWSLYPGLPLPTIAWIRENYPAKFTRISHFFSLNDFIVFQFTGKKVTNPSNAGGMQLLEIQTRNWSGELCQLAGISPEKLSEVYPSGTIISEINQGILQKIGLNEGVLLVNGAHDQVATVLGLGITDPGNFLLACGTAWVVTGILKKPDIKSLPNQLDINHHAYPDRWTISQSLGGLGASLEWWINQAWRDKKQVEQRTDRFTSLNKEVSTTNIDQSLFFYPITGGHLDPATTYFGGFEGLQLKHSRSDLARAIMESAGYELRWAFDLLKDSSIEIDTLTLVGGASHSVLWPSLLSDITGLSINLSDYTRWPSLGASILAGVGSGVYDDFDDAIKRFKKLTKRIRPESDNHKCYVKRFHRYKIHCEQRNSIVNEEL